MTGQMIKGCKRWFHQWGSPKWFYERSQVWSKWLGWIALVCIPAGLIWGLLFAPEHSEQGNSYRIIYLHVPAAALAQTCYMLMAVAGLVSLVWRIKVADVVLKSAAPIGASFCFLALFTGAVWGKPTWGTWWVWDARLTSMLILLFLYFGVIALESAIQDKIIAARATALLAIVGVVNIVIIKGSVEWWNTLHQGATFSLTERPKMAPEMWQPLLVEVIGIYACFGYSLFFRSRNEILERERRTLWVKELVASKGS